MRRHVFLMLERILELNSALIDIVHPDVSMSDAQCNEMKQLEGLLCDPFLTTKKIQAADLTPGLFFKEWKKLILKFSQIGGSLADAMRTSTESREKVLLGNNVLLAAIYADPMYRVTLNDDERAKGRAALLQIALSLKYYEEIRTSANLFEEEIHSSRKENFSFTSESEDEDFEKLLDKQAKRRRTDTEGADVKSSPLRRFKMNFNNALTEMENINRSLKMYVMDAISRYPATLNRVAYAVTALPSAQVSVERLFSALCIIRSHLRTSMNTLTAKQIFEKLSFGPSKANCLFMFIFTQIYVLN